AFPAICVRLREAEVCEHAVSELARNLLNRSRTKVEGWNQREDGRPGIRGSIHIADVDFVEGCLTHAKNQRAALFEAYVRGAFDQLRGDAIRDSRQGTDAARQNDHGVRGIGSAGNVRANVVVRLLVDFGRLLTEELVDKPGSALEPEFLGHHAEGVVGGDKIYGCDSPIAINRQQQLSQE